MSARGLRLGLVALTHGTMMLAGGSGCASAAPIAAPSTYDDPLPPVPDGAEARDHDITVVVLGDQRDMARSVVTEFAEAVARADERQLLALLADPLYQVSPFLSQYPRERDEVVDAILQQAAQQNRVDAPSQAAELVDLAAVETMPLGAAQGTLPRGLRSTDILVTFPLTSRGIRALRGVLGWDTGRVVVRPEDPARVVGF